MHCSICQTPIPSAAAYCPACGAAVPVGNVEQTSPGEESSFVYMEYAGAQAEPASMSSTPPAGSIPPPYGREAFPGIAYAAPTWGAASPPFPRAVEPQYLTTPVEQRPPAPRQRQGLLIGLIVAVALVGLVILGGGGLLYYNVAVVQPAAFRVHATATAQAAITATAYANSPQGAYTAATGGNPEITDSLNGQNQSEFSAYADSKFGGSCTFLDGALHAIQMISHRFFYCPGADSFSDFAMQVQMQIQQGDRGGMIFRANPTSGALYLLTISASGQFDFYKYTQFSASGSMILFDGDAPVFHAGLNQENLVTLIVRGQYIFLYINKVYAGELSDAAYTGGRIGLVADNSTQYTDVAYTNVQIWNLAS